VRKAFLLAAIAAIVSGLVLAGYHASAQNPPTGTPGYGVRRPTATPGATPTAPTGVRPAAPASGMRPLPTTSTVNPTTPAAPVSTASGGGISVALLDVSLIFQKHTRFKQMREAMMADVQKAENDAKAERDAIKGLMEQLRSLQPGSPDYKAMEEQIAVRQSNLEARVRLQRKEFVQREAKIYHYVYQEILQEVHYYAQSNRIAMVLRFSGETADVENPDTVIRYINRPVVWHNPQFDITNVILQRLQGSAAVGNTRPGVNYR